MVWWPSFVGSGSAVGGGVEVYSWSLCAAISRPLSCLLCSSCLPPPLALLLFLALPKMLPLSRYSPHSLRGLHVFPNPEFFRTEDSLASIFSTSPSELIKNSERNFMMTVAKNREQSRECFPVETCIVADIFGLPGAEHAYGSTMHLVGFFQYREFALRRAKRAEGGFQPLKALQGCPEYTEEA